MAGPEPPEQTKSPTATFEARDPELQGPKRWVSIWPGRTGPGRPPSPEEKAARHKKAMDRRVRFCKSCHQVKPPDRIDARNRCMDCGRLLRAWKLTEEEKDSLRI